MLEKYIAALIVPYLAKFAENIDEKQLRIDLWNGRASLSDLVIKASVLDSLLDSGNADGGSGGSGRLPLRIHRGVCKNVSLRIPVRHLRSEPIVIEIGELLLTVCGGTNTQAMNNCKFAEAPHSRVSKKKKAASWDAVATQKEKELGAYEAERKRHKEVVDAAAKVEGAEDAKAGKGGNYFTRLAELIVNNIIVKMNAVHVRYEDISGSAVIGAILGDVQLLAIDEQTNQPSFTDPSKLQRLFKRLVFSDLQVYCDDPREMRANAAIGRCWYTRIEDWQAWYHAMRQRIRDGNVGNSTILGPVAGSIDAQLVFKKYIQELLMTPYVAIKVQLQHIMARLTRAQYTTIVQTVSMFSNWADIAAFASFRPTSRVKGHAREWWRYAIRVIQVLCAEPRRERVLNRLSDAFTQDYQSLYRDVMYKVELTPERKRDYKFICRFMTVKSMIAGRQRVYTQLASDIQARRKDKEEARRAAEAALAATSPKPLASSNGSKNDNNNRSSWFGWLFGRKTEEVVPTASKAQSDLDAEDIFLRDLERDYGIVGGNTSNSKSICKGGGHLVAGTAPLSASASDAGGGTQWSVSDEDDRSLTGAGTPMDTTPGPAPSQLPLTYKWFSLILDLPYLSAHIDMANGLNTTLQVQQLGCQVVKFNKKDSLQIFLRLYNIVVTNPVRTYAGGSLIPNLVEAMNVGVRHTQDSVTAMSGTSTSMSGGLVTTMPTLGEIVHSTAKARQQTHTAGAATSGIAGTSAGSTSGHPHRDDANKMNHTPIVYSNSNGGVAISPLLELDVFLNPPEQPLPDTRLDTAIRARLLPLRIAIDPDSITDVLDFFSLPSGIDVSRITESTLQAASAVGTAATHELRRAMSNVKGVLLSVDVSAPFIIAPRSLRGEREEAAVVVSLGRIRVESHPLTETEKRRRRRSAAADASEDMLYYSNKAMFSKLYAEITTVEGAVLRPRRGFMLLHEVLVMADFLVRIDDSNTRHESVIVRLKVPKLRIDLSVHQAYVVTNIVESWVGQFKKSSHKGEVYEALAKLENYVKNTSIVGIGGEDKGGEEQLLAPFLGINRASFVLPSASMAAPELLGSITAAIAAVTTAAAVAAVPRVRKVLEIKDVPSTTALTPLPPRVPLKELPPGEDMPKARVELLVVEVGIHVHEDDPEILRTAPDPRFSLTFASIELIIALRSHTKKLLMVFKEPCIFDTRDRLHPILESPIVRLDVGIPKARPNSVGVLAESAVIGRIGTPFMELLEVVMDVVNLILSLVDSAEGKIDTKILNEEQLHMSPTDLIYQLQVIHEQWHTPNKRVVNLSVSIRGTARIEFWDRRAGDTQDYPLVVAEGKGIEMFLKKNKVTIDLTCGVRELTGTIMTDHMGLLDGNKVVIYSAKPSSHQQDALLRLQTPKNRPSRLHSSGKKSKIGVSPLPTPTNARRSSNHHRSKNNNNHTGGGDNFSTREKDGAAATSSSSHFTISYRRSRPVMPMFEDVDGKRTLTNPGELCFSSALGVTLGASIVCVDVHTVMILYNYLTNGFLTRMTQVGDRPLYNGRSLPPIRPGPRTLMRMTVKASDIALELPLDARSGNCQDRYSLAIGDVVVQNIIYGAQEQHGTNVTLKDISMSRVGAATSSRSGKAEAKAHSTRVLRSLLPANTSMEVYVRSDIDQLSLAPMNVAIKCDDLTFDLVDEDVVDIMAMMHQNITCAGLDPREMSVAECSMVWQMPNEEDAISRSPSQLPRKRIAATAAGAAWLHHVELPPPGPPREILMTLLVANLGLRFFHLVGSGRVSGSSSSSRSTRRALPPPPTFTLTGTTTKLLYAFNEHRLEVDWNALEVLDGRGGVTSNLMQCDAGSVQLVDAFATKASLSQTLGIRQTTHASVEASATIPSGATHCGNTLEQDSSAKGIVPLTDTTAVATTSSATPAAAEAPFMMRVFSLEFTLRRFALSDQWLTVYDTFCNETVSAVNSAPQSVALALSRSIADGTTRPATLEHPPLQPTPQAAFRCIVTTPSVVVPLLTTQRSILAEAHATALLADMVFSPEGNSFAVKMQDLRLFDMPSGLTIVSKLKISSSTDGAAWWSNEEADDDDISGSSHGDTSMKGEDFLQSAEDETRCASRIPLQKRGQANLSSLPSSFPFSLPPLPPLEETVAATATEAATDRGSEDVEVLEVFFTTNPAALKNTLKVTLRQLDVLLSMPIVYGLMDYFTSPVQPASKIASLGVMREQRERMARAAENMVATSALQVQLFWQRPRIVMVGDALDLKDTSRQVEAQLGVLRAAFLMDRRNDAFALSLKISDFGLVDFLDKCTLCLTMTSHRGNQQVLVILDKTIAILLPSEVERLAWVLQRNVMLPREALRYYGDLMEVATPVPVPSPPVLTASTRTAAATYYDEVPPTVSVTQIAKRSAPASPATSSVSRKSGSTKQKKKKAAATHRASMSSLFNAAASEDSLSISAVAADAAAAVVTPSRKPSTLSRDSTEATSPPPSRTEPSASSPPLHLPAAAASTATPTPVRTTHVRFNGLLLALYDLSGSNTHTVNLSALDVDIAANGDVKLWVPEINVVEHFTDQFLLMSVSPEATAARGAVLLKDPDPTTLAAAAPATEPQCAVFITRTAATNHTQLLLSAVVVKALPKGIGGLVDTLLSIQYPTGLYTPPSSTPPLTFLSTTSTPRRTDKSSAGAAEKEENSMEGALAATLRPSEAQKSMKNATGDDGGATVVAAVSTLAKKQVQQQQLQQKVGKTVSSTSTTAVVVPATTGMLTATSEEAELDDEERQELLLYQSFVYFKRRMDLREAVVAASASEAASVAAATTSVKTENVKGELAMEEEGNQPISTFAVRLAECCIRFVHDDEDVAEARLSVVCCELVSYEDGSSKTQFTLDALSMEDTCSLGTLYPKLLASCADHQVHSHGGEKAKASAAEEYGAEAKKFIDFIHWSDSPANAVAVDAPPSPPLPVPTTAKEAESGPLPGLTPNPLSTSPSTLSSSSLQTSPRYYAKYVNCEVGNLSVVIVPQLARVLVAAMSEVQNYVSEGNRRRAFEFVNDHSTEVTNRRDVQALTKVDLVIHRPRFLIVKGPTSSQGIELYPGKLAITSRLVHRDDSTGRMEEINVRRGANVGRSSAFIYTNSSVPATTCSNNGSSSGVINTKQKSGSPRSGGDGAVGAGTSSATISSSCGSGFSQCEVLELMVEKMDIKLLGQDAFKRDCLFTVTYLRCYKEENADASVSTAAAAHSQTQPRSLQSKATAASSSPSRTSAPTLLENMPPAAELTFSIPTLAIALSTEQAEFAMDVFGAFLNDEARHSKRRSCSEGEEGAEGGQLGSFTTPQNGGRHTSRTSPTSAVAGAAASPHSPPPLGAISATTMASPSGDGGGPRRRRETSLMASPSGLPRTSGEIAAHYQKKLSKKSFRIIATIDELDADIVYVFHLSTSDVKAMSHSSPAVGGILVVTVASVCIQHIGAHVEEIVQLGATVTRNEARLNDVVDVLKVKDLMVRSVRPAPVLVRASVEHSAYLSTETVLDVATEAIHITISPTILFDTREVLYLPFCYKVFRIPIDPLPILKLDDAITVLNADLTLDDKHVLLTTNRTRCCYELDLNKHCLSFTGPPSGQIVLSEGCQLTISNGTIVIPGMYTLGSFVSYGPATTLFTTDTCTIEKQYQNIANTTFFDISALETVKAAAAAAAAAERGGRQRTGRPGTSRSDSSPMGEGTTYGSEALALMEELWHDRTERLVASFTCKDAEVHVISEEVMDFSSTVCMEIQAKLMQDNEHRAVSRRTVDLQVFDLHSGVSDEHVLLPTNLTATLSGVDNVSVTIALDSLEFCTRTALLRSFVELGKDFGTAFLEESTLRRTKPTVQFESATFAPLVPVVTPGQCQHCGQFGAFIGSEATAMGVLCYRCCTGKDCMPATDFRIDVPLIDAVFVGTNGDLTHFCLHDTVFGLDPNMDMQVVLRGSLYTFSNSASVWEPLIEMFEGGLVGSANTHDYRIRVDRLDFVLSPMSIYILRRITTDYNTTTTLQKRLRNKFRRRAQRRAVAAYNGLPMYVDVDDYVNSGDSDALDDVPDLDVDLSHSLMASGSVFDVMRNSGHFYNTATAATAAAVATLNAGRERRSRSGSTSRRRSLLVAAGKTDAKKPKTHITRYAHVRVFNFCNRDLVISGQGVSPFGGRVEFNTVNTSVTVNRLVPLSQADKGYVVSLSYPPLYLEGRDMLLETSVSLSREEGARHLKRFVNMKIYPLHTQSNSIICVENHLGCTVNASLSHSAMQPGERVYLPTDANLKTKILIQPVVTLPGITTGQSSDASATSAREIKYAPGVALEGGYSPTIRDLLSTTLTQLVCRPVAPPASEAAASATAAAAQVWSPLSMGSPRFHLHPAGGGGGGGRPSKDKEQHSGRGGAATGPMMVCVVIKQEAIRGGVPSFVISIEPRFRLHNRLPYDVTLTLIPDVNGNVVKGKADASAYKGTRRITVQSEDQRELPLGTFSLSQVAVVVEARQVEGDMVEVYTSTALNIKSSSESFHITLRSQQSEQREMTLCARNVATTVLLTSPFLIVNHAPLDLTVQECIPTTGELRCGPSNAFGATPLAPSAIAERNFTYLPANMGVWFVAAPLDCNKKEELFVNVCYKNFIARRVPLHVQQRGLIVMEEMQSEESGQQHEGKDRPLSGNKTRRHPVGRGTTSGMPASQRRVCHLAYVTRVDRGGSRCVTIAPRWIIINRTRFPLFVAPSAYGGFSAREAYAAATAALTAEHADSEASPTGTPTQHTQEIDAYTEALKKTAQKISSAEARSVFLQDRSYAVVLGSGHSMPLYRTPFCPPDLGYHLHVLQDLDAPLYGTPVELETIHMSTVVAYKPPGESEEGAVIEQPYGYVCDAPVRAKPKRDRFFEVSLSAGDPYTYVIIEEPKVVPFLLLNRTSRALELRDTSDKSDGRILGRVAAGCGTELILDTTVTMKARVVLLNDDGTAASDNAEGGKGVVFDLSRNMSHQEIDHQQRVGGGLEYRLSYGEYGQQLVEIVYGSNYGHIARTSRACPPTPINLLLNVSVVTIALVMPGKDVIFAAITDTRFSWDREHAKEVLHFSIKNFQVDNQTEITPRYDACLLAIRKSEAGAAISGFVERHIVPVRSLWWIEEARLDVTPIALRVSDTLLVSLAKLFRKVKEITEYECARASGEDAQSGAYDRGVVVRGRGTDSRGISASQRCPTPVELFDAAPRQANVLLTSIILERFIINPIVLRVWLNRDGEHDFFRENLNSKDSAMLSMMVKSCDDVRVSIPGIASVKRSSRLGVMLHWLAKSYLDALLAQLKGLIFQYASSLPFIGAPLKFVSGISGGAVRMYKEPVDGLATSKRAFAQGLASGSAGFALEFAGGGLSAFANLTDAGSRLLSMGGGVSEQERRKQNTLTAIADGFKGVYKRPMEGHAESGAAGLIKGVAQGLLGVVTNPLSGLLSDFSRATGIAAKLATDTYIPSTKRLRPIRDFYANGGVATWRTVVCVYQYQRVTSTIADHPFNDGDGDAGVTSRGGGSTAGIEGGFAAVSPDASLSVSGSMVGGMSWSSEALRMGVDGPAWYPCRREVATHGSKKISVPAEAWKLDRYGTSFEGWTFSTKYYGIYTDRMSDRVRIRRKRWVALVRPLIFSPVAKYLNICPGMETKVRVRRSLLDGGNGSNNNNAVFLMPEMEAPTFVSGGSASVGEGGDMAGVGIGVRPESITSMDVSASDDVSAGFSAPGVLSACTAQEAEARNHLIASIEADRRKEQMGGQWWLHRNGKMGPPREVQMPGGLKRHETLRASSANNNSGGGRGAGGGGGLHAHARGMSDFFTEDEYVHARAPSWHERMRSWTATGRHTGVRSEALRTKSVVFLDQDNDDGNVKDDGDDEGINSTLQRQSTNAFNNNNNAGGSSSASGTGSGGASIINLNMNVQAPEAPRVGKMRGDTSKSNHSRSNSGAVEIFERQGSCVVQVPPVKAPESHTEHHASGQVKEDLGRRQKASRKAKPNSISSSAASATPLPRLRGADSRAGFPAGPAGRAQETLVEMYEYEARAKMRGWSRRNLDSACPAWQDTHGREVQAKANTKVPAGWSWLGEWHHVGGGDRDGWTVLPSDANVRRRLWQRRMVREAKQK